MRLTPKLELKLDTGYKFKRAVDCNLTELESVLDYYAPAHERKGYWPHNPEAPDPAEFYRACHETLRAIDPNTKSSITQRIRKALADKEEGSSKILEITKTLAGYLLKNEREEK